MKQYLDLVKLVLENGNRKTSRTGIDTISYFGAFYKVDLSKGFPLLTTKKMQWKSLLHEVLWYLSGEDHIRNLSKHTKIWDAWADENGSIGKAYGYQLGVKHKYRDGEFDHVDRVLYDLKNNPSSRRIITNIYVHEDLHEMNLYPCAYSVTFNVTGNKLNAILNQRSQDMLVANGWNVCQYAALVHLMARSVGLIPGEFVHVIADAHIYDRHVPIVEELIERPKFQAPKLIIDEGITDFYSFSTENVRLENYLFGAKITGIPVAV